MQPELCKQWSHNGFNVRLYDTGQYDEYGKCILAWRFSDTKANIVMTSFGTNGHGNLHCSPMIAIDSIDAVYGLLDFISMRHGDIEEDYFAHYTPEQIAWSESSRCEELQMIAVMHQE